MMIRLLLAAALAAALAACSGPEDELPADTPVTSPVETDIWLAELLDSGRRLRVGTPQNATDRPGYDNQPAFLPDNSGFLYTAVDQTGQADTWRYELERGRKYRVTRTAEGEFSPTPLPDGGFSVVRVEADNTQRLWRFDADGANATLLLEDVKPVGYHAWLDEHRVGLFILGEPPTLAIADTRTGESRTVLSSIGRSLHRVPGEDRLSVLLKAADDDWRIVLVDPASGETTDAAPMLQPAEDYAWLQDGRLIMGRGSKLYLYEPGEDDGWHELADLAEHGITQITRIAVSPDASRIAFVVQN